MNGNLFGWLIVFFLIKYISLRLWFLHCLHRGLFSIHSLLSLLWWCDLNFNFIVYRNCLAFSSFLRLYRDSDFFIVRAYMFKLFCYGGRTLGDKLVVLFCVRHYLLDVHSLARTAHQVLSLAVH